MGKVQISRNPSDYSPRVHAIVRAMAKHFFDGDEQKAWEAFFKQYAEDLASGLLDRIPPQKSQPGGTVRIFLKVKPKQE